MFVEIFITTPFINGIELGLQDTGGMLKLGCDQKRGPLNHASTRKWRCSSSGLDLMSFLVKSNYSFLDSSLDVFG